MPTYEYACKFCGKHHDIYQSIKDEPLRRCPSCKKLGLRRLISGGAGIIFKGTGFYETDYKRKSTPEKSSSESTPNKSAETKTAETKTSSETKTPAKTEAPKAKPASP